MLPQDGTTTPRLDQYCIAALTSNLVYTRFRIRRSVSFLLPLLCTVSICRHARYLHGHMSSFPTNVIGQYFDIHLINSLHTFIATLDFGYSWLIPTYSYNRTDLRTYTVHWTTSSILHNNKSISEHGMHRSKDSDWWATVRWPYQDYWWDRIKEMIFMGA